MKLQLSICLLERANQLGLQESIEAFHMYLTRNYVNAEKAVLWNCSERPRKRSNNDQEGMNNRLKRYIDNANFWAFMKSIIKEIRRQRLEKSQMRHGGKFKGQRLKWVNLDRQINEIKQEFAENNADNNIIPFLQRIRLCIHNA